MRYDKVGKMIDKFNPSMRGPKAKLVALFMFVLLSVGADTVMGQAGPTPEATPTPNSAANGEGESFFTRLFGGEHSALDTSREPWTVEIPRATMRLAVAGLLATLLAFRPRRGRVAVQHNLRIAQTQILLAVVASALMMIVADNAARAFGIFAAAALVRFRTNIRDPKEITIILVGLGIGLATGVGRWPLGLVLTLFTLVVLWLLEWYEPAKTFRPMELTVKTHNMDGTEASLKEVFKKHKVKAELLELNREDDIHPLGKVVYDVTVAPRVSTDELSDEIFSADAHNIDSVQWHHKKRDSLD